MPPHGLNVAFYSFILAKHRKTGVESRDAVILGQPDSALRIDVYIGHPIVGQTVGSREDAVDRPVAAQQDQPSLPGADRNFAAWQSLYGIREAACKPGIAPGRKRFHAARTEAVQVRISREQGALTETNGGVHALTGEAFSSRDERQAIVGTHPHESRAGCLNIESIENVECPA